MLKWDVGHLWSNVELVCHCYKIACILPRHVGYAANLSLTLQKRLVIERWDFIEANCIDRDHATFTETGESIHHDLPPRGKGHSTVELNRRLIVLRTNPSSP